MQKGPRRSSRLASQLPRMPSVATTDEIEEEIIEEIEEPGQPLRRTRTRQVRKRRQSPKARSPRRPRSPHSPRRHHSPHSPKRPRSPHSPKQPRSSCSPKRPHSPHSPRQPPLRERSEVYVHHEQTPTEEHRSYMLRSTTGDMEVLRSAPSTVDSIDEEEEEEVRRMGRSISEQRFRKHVTRSKYASSTPYPGTPTSRRPRLEYEEEEDSSVSIATSSNFRRITESTSTTTTIQPPPIPMPVMPDNVVEQSFIMEDSESDEEEPPIWLHVGWKECVFGSFVSGILVVGYICYCSDICWSNCV